MAHDLLVIIDGLKLADLYGEKITLFFLSPFLWFRTSIVTREPPGMSQFFSKPESFPFYYHWIFSKHDPSDVRLTDVFLGC